MAMDAFFLPYGPMLLLRVVHACGFTRTDLCAVENHQWELEKMAQWVRALAAPARGPEFRSYHSHKKHHTATRVPVTPEM